MPTGAKTAAAVAAGAAVAGLVAREVVRRRSDDDDGEGRHPDGWKAVTVLTSGSELREGSYPAPLADIAQWLEIRLVPAPGDRGTEVHARVRDGDEKELEKHSGRSSGDAVRIALRDAKQLIESGEILHNRPRPHGKRPTTITGKLVDAAEDKSEGGGVL